MSGFHPHLSSEAAELIGLCREQGLSVATAESCTGGLVSACLTEAAGASDVFERGFVTYSNQSKTELLGVNPKTLEIFGAVSKETALEMAHGALKRSAAGLAVAVTGIAGPGGGTAAKPVGLVYLAVAGRAVPNLQLECSFGNIGRSQIRTEFVRAAIRLLRQAMSNIDPRA